MKKPENQQKEAESGHQPALKQGKVSEKVKTGVGGFDEMISGGIPKGSIVVLSGAPGSGKTIFCLQFIYNGLINFDESCVLVLLEESKEDVMETAYNFGWDLQKFVDSKKLVILSITLYDFEILKNNIEDSIRSISASRLVIDPGVIFKLFFEKELEARKNIVALGKIIKKYNCTTLITSEMSLESDTSLYGLEEYVADGVVLMYHSRVKNKFVRSLAIVKMRNTKISEQLKPLSINSEGIKVHVDSELFQ